MMILILCAAVSFVLAVICGVIFIPALRRLKFGQEIREVGPSWHKNKSGTPTMGGIIFIISSIASAVIVPLITSYFMPAGTAVNFSYITAIGLTALGFGLVGFVDDYIKVVKKRNLGLTAKQKFLAQAIIAVLFSVWAYFSDGVGSEIAVPFTNISFDLGIFYIPIVLFIMLGGVNSVNLTDGLDGLASSVTAVVSLFFCIAFFAIDMSLSVVFSAYFGAAEFSAALLGGLLGFLVFNKYPAKVFMGDTGSLFLGGAVSAMAVVLGNPLILILVGFIYICETLSVIIQVSVYKATGKRVFKMSPLHHHFEMCGWSERKIVAVFTAVTAVMCIVAFFSIFGL